MTIYSAVYLKLLGGDNKDSHLGSNMNINNVICEYKIHLGTLGQEMMGSMVQIWPVMQWI